jgi:hypothetical protein
MIGAIAGAVVGIFLGQGVVANARSEANSELAQATNNFEQAKRMGAEESLKPEFFSYREEISGTRDNNFDDESAYANVLRPVGRD